MTLAIARPRAVAALPIGLWDRIAEAPAWAVLTLVWAAMTLPLLVWRGYAGDEGLAVSLARSMVEGGPWIEPEIFGRRKIERPVLQSWVMAALAVPWGVVPQWLARATSALPYLGMALLVHALVKPYVSRAAALMGAMCALVAPSVLPHGTAVLADVPTAAGLFLALAVWWWRCEARDPRPFDWLLVGVILAVTALLKGPQPIAHFALGAGVYTLLTRQWSKVPWLILAGIVSAIPVGAWYAYVFEPGDQAEWARFMRPARADGAVLPPATDTVRFLTQMLAEAMPALLLAIPAAILAARGEGSAMRRRLVLVLALYAGLATLLVMVWPHAKPRHAMPMIPALAALAALAYDDMVERAHRLVAASLVVGGGLALYGIAYAVIAAPLAPQAFRLSLLDAARVQAVHDAAPAPITRSVVAALNEMPYVRARIAETGLQNLPAVRGPGFLLVGDDEASFLRERRPDAREVLAFGPGGGRWRLFRID